MIRNLVTAIFVTALGTACATIEHAPITDTEDKTDTGIRYYRASPYILVYANSAGRIDTELKYMPDPHLLMSAKPTQWLSSLDVTLEFKDGVLTKSETTADTSILPKAILTAAKTAATAILARTDDSGPSVPKPYLFKIVQVKSGDYRLIGGTTDEQFELKL